MFPQYLDNFDLKYKLIIIVIIAGMTVSVFSQVKYPSVSSQVFFCVAEGVAVFTCFSIRLRPVRLC